MAGALALGQGIYGFYKGMDDQKRLDMEHEQSQFNLEDAKRKSAAEQELQPLRMQNARGAIDMMNAETNLIPTRQKAAENQAALTGLQVTAAQRAQEVQARQQKAVDTLQAGFTAGVQSGMTKFKPFEDAMSTIYGGLPVSITDFSDPNGHGVNIKVEGMNPTTLYDGMADDSSKYPWLKEYEKQPAAEKLFQIMKAYLTPGGVSAAMDAHAKILEKRAEEQAKMNIETAKERAAAARGDTSAASRENVAGIHAAAIVGGVNARADAAEKKQTKKDAENYVRSYTAETKRIASVRGTTGPLATMINKSDVLISQMMPSLRPKVQQDYPDLQGDQAAQKAWDIAETQMSAAISQMQRKPQSVPAMQREMRDAGWSDEAVREATNAAKKPAKPQS